MRRVQSKDTTAERSVRSVLHKAGYRFSLFRKDLPGNPDIVLPKYRTVIFVHGCFWHRHNGCPQASTPESNVEYWTAKFARNQKRDRCNQRRLRQKGWKVVILWECQIKKREQIVGRLKSMLARPGTYGSPQGALLRVAEAEVTYRRK